MAERAVLVMAGATWLGAWLAVPAPWWFGFVVSLAAFLVRRPWLLCFGVLLLAGSLASSSRAGLEGLHAATVEADVLLLTDPESFGDEVRVEVRLGRRHLEAWASGSAGESILGRAAGEHVDVRGRLEPFESIDGRRLSRHLAGRIEVGAVRAWREGSLLARTANGYRSLLAGGSSSLGDDQRSLLAGLALGDDRAQSPALVDAFRGSGLTHLLAVSGQNVAFVLLIVEPIARRLPLHPRLVATVSVLVLFGVVTRFEPSVLRATVMAGIAVATAAGGRPADGRRVLGLAVTALLLIDPLLVHSVGFQLSVAASLGIILWAAPIADRLPVPSWIARPVGVIVAAQFSVAPILLITFGPLPAASLPANLLAGPAAGPAMIWGMTGGALAGMAPAWLAALIHAPTRVLLGWIELVARVLSSLPLGGFTGLTMVAVGLAALWWRFGPSRAAFGPVAPALAAFGLAAPVAAAVLSPVPVRQSLGGATVWRQDDTAVLVLHEDVRPVDLLGGLRRARVRGLDLIAVEDDLDVASIDALRDRFGPVPVLADGGPEPRVEVGGSGSTLSIGALTIIVRRAGSRPVFDVVSTAVRSPGASGARAPPL